MAEKNNQNKIITITLAIIICLAAIVLLYVNLPDGSSDTDDETTDDTNGGDEVEELSVVLTVTYGETENEYTLGELENFTSTTGTARKLKASPFFSTGTIMISPEMTEQANQYTGVKISTIINEISNLPETYNVTISAPDGYDTTLNNSEINGNMVTYNETGNETYIDISVILAYKENEEYLSDDAPLKVAIVGDEPVSLSNIWVSDVVLIEIVE